MEITLFIQKIQSLESDLESVSLSSVEKDILLKKIAALYESLLLRKTAISPEKPVAEALEATKPETPIVEEKTILIEETKEPLPEKKLEVIQPEIHGSEPEKMAINAEIPNSKVEEKNEIKTTHSLLDAKSEKSSLNERFQTKEVGLNERASQGDLRKMLDFNRTILFTTELFAKDSVAFSKTIDKLNAAQTLEEAFTFLNNEIIHTYKWKPDSESVRLFEKMVRQKFGA